MENKIFIALVMTIGLLLTACDKSNDSMVEEYRTATEEFIEAVNSNDADMIKEKGEKVEELSNALKKRNLSLAEKREVARITVKFWKDLSKTDFKSLDYGGLLKSARPSNEELIEMGKNAANDSTLRDNLMDNVSQWELDEDIQQQLQEIFDF